jgi:ribosomal protein S3AE
MSNNFTDDEKKEIRKKANLIIAREAETNQVKEFIKACAINASLASLEGNRDGIVIMISGEKYFFKKA